MFEDLRKKEKLCVILNDDKTPEEEKFKEYKKYQNIYKLVDLKKREDLVKVETFKKMLDDSNANYNCIEMIQKIHKELVYAMYLAYLVQKNSYQYKKELMNIDAFIKSEDVEIYKLTNQIKVVKALRISKFYLYRLLSKEITRRMETTK